MWNQLRKMAEHQLTACVDVDGTLLDYGKYEKNKFGGARKEVVDKLRELRDKGVRVVLSTARQADETEALNNHLDELGISELFDEVILGKNP